jgi:hypothetical protein
MDISTAPWLLEVRPTKTGTILQVIDQHHHALAVVKDKSRNKLANAYLMAAAPEMLQALDHVLRANRRSEALDQNGNLHPFLIYVIEEVINKAKGKTND